MGPKGSELVTKLGEDIRVLYKKEMILGIAEGLLVGSMLSKDGAVSLSDSLVAICKDGTPEQIAEMFEELTSKFYAKMAEKKK